MQKIRAYPSNTAGLIALDAGDFVRAAKMFLDAIDCDPDIPDYWNNFGLALMESARYDPDFWLVAMECFLEAIEIDPTLPQPFMNIGQCFSRLGRKEQAYRWYRLAVEQDKKGILWEHCWQFGMGLIKEGEYPLATEYLQYAQHGAAMNRICDRRIYRSLAMGYAALGDDDKALEALRQMHACPAAANP
jgi:tetratricopeptide (TPR) repeat protein